MTWWAYCIVAHPNAAPLGAPGVEREREVELVQEGELVALVSAVPLSEYSDDRLREHLNDIEWVERVARAHERVLDQTLEEATILPLRLCTLYRTRRACAASPRAQRLLLDELSGSRDAGWALKVFVDRPLGGDPRGGARARLLTESAEAVAALGGAAHAALGRAASLCHLQEFGDSVARSTPSSRPSPTGRAHAAPRPELHGRMSLRRSRRLPVSREPTGACADGGFVAGAVER